MRSRHYEPSRCFVIMRELEAADPVPAPVEFLAVAAGCSTAAMREQLQHMVDARQVKALPHGLYRLPTPALEHPENLDF